MGAAGRLGVLLFFWCFFFPFLGYFFDDGVGWGWGRWDVNVHVDVHDVTLIMGWRGVGWGGMLTFM